jgi:hypothetical protein
MPSTYVDRIQGLTTSVAVKAPVRTVATTPITLSGLQTIDGVTLVLGDRVLVTAQANSAANGIYVASSGDWARAADFDGSLDIVRGTLVVSTNTPGSLYYRVTSADPITIGTDAITFEQVSGSLTQATVGAALYPRTAAEIAAGVTPTDYSKEPGDIRRFGADETGVADSSSAIQDAHDASSYAGGIVAKGTFLAGDVELTKSNIVGPAVLNAATAASSVLLLGSDPNSLSDTAGWRYRKVESLYIRGNAKASDGIAFGQTTNPELAGRWSVENCFITNCDSGLKKAFGNIGQDVRATTFRGNNFGVYAEGQASPVMHAGVFSMYGGSFFAHTLAAVYIDSNIEGTGNVIFEGVNFESNPGFGVFVDSFLSSFTPLVIKNCWFEGNATSPSVTINATAYTPKDIYIKDTTHAIVEKCIIRSVKFENSNVLLESCTFSTADYTDIEVTNATVRVVNASTNGFKNADVTVESLSKARRTSGTNADAFRTLPRAGIAYSAPNGTRLFSETFSSIRTYQLTGTGTITSTQVDDGTLYGKCAEFVMPDTYTNTYTAFAITTDKWYAYTIDFKQVTGDAPEIRFTDATTLARDFHNALTDGWSTLGGVCKATTTGNVKLWFRNQTGADSTFRLGCVQVIEFDAERDAIEFFNGRLFFAPGAILTGTATYDPASLNDGTGATTTVTVTGAALGDFVEGVSFSLDLQGITLTAWVSAADTVSVRFQNESGGVLDLGSGTIRARVRKA